MCREDTPLKRRDTPLHTYVIKSIMHGHVTRFSRHEICCALARCGEISKGVLLLGRMTARIKTIHKCIIRAYITPNRNSYMQPKV